MGTDLGREEGLEGREPPWVVTLRYCEHLWGRYWASLTPTGVGACQNCSEPQRINTSIEDCHCSFQAVPLYLPFSPSLFHYFFLLIQGTEMYLVCLIVVYIFFCINSHNQRESFPQTSYFYLLNMTEAFYFNHPLLCTGDWPDIALTYCVTRDLYIPMYFELLLWRVASLFSLFPFLKRLILQIFHFTVLRLMGAISNIKVFPTPILYVFYLNYSCLL